METSKENTSEFSDSITISNESTTALAKPLIKDFSLDELKSLSIEIQALIQTKLLEETSSTDMLPIARHISLLPAIESVVMSYKNLYHPLIFDEQRQLDPRSVKLPALQAFNTRLERLCCVIYLQPNNPFPSSLLSSLMEVKGLVYYRCLAQAPLPSLIADDRSLFAFLDHLIESLNSLRAFAIVR